MVWWLTALDSGGPGPFYFTAPGVYTVGRKDCTIAIHTDKSISRLHAEISVEAAPQLLPGQKGRDSLPRSKIILKDLSKFGSFVNKDTDSTPVNLRPDKVSVLREGDVVTFGISKAEFRVHYLPLVICMPSSIFPSTTELRSKAEAVGAYVLEQWNHQCSHLIVEETSLVTDLVIAAVLSRKPVLQLEWLQALLSQISPIDQLPSMSRYIPTLKMNCRGNALPTSIAEPTVRQDTLAGFTVFLERGCLYHYQDLPILVNAGGGVVKYFTHNNLKDVAGSVRENGLLVFSAEQVATRDSLIRKLLPTAKHLHPTSEENLLRCILNAKLDLSLPSLSPAASVDTGETVDEEDAEIVDDVISSVRQESVEKADLKLQLDAGAFVAKRKESDTLDKTKAVLEISSSVWKSRHVESSKHSDRANLGRSMAMDSRNRERVKSEAGVDTSSKQPVEMAGDEGPHRGILKSEEDLGPSSQVQAEVIFDNLIVRKDPSGLAAEVRNGAVSNFKRFKRKGFAASGNSFSALVPFAKDPYREGSYQQEMGEYVKQDKKRKEAELVADDLFNAEKLKRRRVTAKEAGASKSLAT